MVKNRIKHLIGEASDPYQYKLMPSIESAQVEHYGSDILNHVMSLQKSEYGHPLAHIHKLGGANMIDKQIADEFLKDPNVKLVYLDQTRKEDTFIIVIEVDADDMSLRLAKTTVEASRKNPNYYFDYDYITYNNFDILKLPSGVKIFTRE